MVKKNCRHERHPGIYSAAQWHASVTRTQPSRGLGRQNHVCSVCKQPGHRTRLVIKGNQEEHFCPFGECPWQAEGCEICKKDLLRISASVPAAVTQPPVSGSDGRRVERFSFSRGSGSRALGAKLHDKSVGGAGAAAVDVASRLPGVTLPRRQFAIGASYGTARLERLGAGRRRCCRFAKSIDGRRLRKNIADAVRIRPRRLHSSRSIATTADRGAGMAV